MVGHELGAASTSKPMFDSCLKAHPLGRLYGNDQYDGVLIEGPLGLLVAVDSWHHVEVETIGSLVVHVRSTMLFYEFSEREAEPSKPLFQGFSHFIK